MSARGHQKGRWGLERGLRPQNEGSLKNEENIKNEDVLKKWLPLSGTQTRNGIAHNSYTLWSIAHAGTNRKYNIFRQRRRVPIFTDILVRGHVTKQTRHWTYFASLYFSLFDQLFKKICNNSLL